jgi:hypothetical protein
MFFLGIRQLLDDLATTLGPERLILAYLDDIYILSNDPNALEDVQASFASRQPSIQLNMAKSKTTALQEARERGMQLLGSCIGPIAVREHFLEAEIAAEEALLAKLVDLPQQHALLVLRQCLQQNLRHLQRSLQSDHLEHGAMQMLTPRLSFISLHTGLPIPGANATAAETAAFALPAWQKSLITSVLSAGTFFGAIIAGDLADYFGRRITIISGCIIFIVGCNSSGLLFDWSRPHRARSSDLGLRRRFHLGHHYSLHVRD